MNSLKIEEQLKNEPNHKVRNFLITFVVILVLVWASDVLKYNGLTKQGQIIAQGIIKGILHPNTEILFSLKDVGIAWLIVETLAIAFLGTILGSIVSLPLAFLASKNIVPKWLTHLVMCGIIMIRTIPVFILGLMWIRVTGPGAFCGVMTMTISSIGMVSKLFIEFIEDIDNGVIEFLDSSGATKYQKVVYGIIPQLSSNFISTAIYRFEINIKNAAVLGLVGAGGIGYPLISAIQNNRWSDAGAYLFGLVILVILVEIFSTKIRKKLAYGE
ncbi:MAG: phosphonate ABC transporter, permease protein PhnE [Lactovum sp.]